jgi:dTMP kinase
MQMSHPSNLGLFLTIEGIEGVGKTTAVKFIQQYLINAHQKFIVTREPGGTETAEQIRKILLAPNPHEDMVPETELLLMFAGRAQHIANIVRPALSEGTWVVCDRFIDASYAYQGAGRGFDLQQIETLDKWIVGDCQPDATILLDAPPQIGLSRAKHRGPQDRIEQEKTDFFERVRAGYLERASNDKKRFHIIDATQPLMFVNTEITTVLDKLLLGKKIDA